MAAGAAFVLALGVMLLHRRNKPPVSNGAAAVAMAACAALLIIPGSSRAQDTVLVSTNGTSLVEALRSVRSGGVVLIESGHYRVRDVSVQRPVKIIGKNFPVLDGEGKGEILRVNAYNVTIEGLSLTGTGVSYTQDRAAIRVTNVGNCRIVGNRFEDNLYGIYLAKVTSCEVADNVLKASGRTEATSGNGIHLWSSREVRIDRNRISGFRDGIYFEFVHDTKVTHNTSEKNLRYGLHFMFSNRFHIVSGSGSRCARANAMGFSAPRIYPEKCRANRQSGSRRSGDWGERRGEELSADWCRLRPS